MNVFFKEINKERPRYVMKNHEDEVYHERHLSELTVCEATDDWQFCIFVKGRSGPPIICSDWKKGDSNLTFDIKEVLQKKGYKLHFAELHFVLGICSLA